eukprot:CAMPEP_0197581236 /NCGR_PEP_ID=MMETSP1326-20131121/4814_1 /TAXON_ID=1155430 /ORGANISM="Genus nov. species nov., Strain RCC2288" /LENGTH=381 /DNA_ID=CAMNT_0043145113 /DNA_START=39 /DNA_END=1180 /DNA_ORIENTATION=-
MTRAGSVAVNVAVTDVGEGSYGVKVIGGNSTGLTCGEWTTSVTLGGVVVKTFTTIVSPAAASPAHSYIIGGAASADGTPFGAVGSVTVQLMDAFGCAAAGTADAGALHAAFKGPHDAPTGIESLGAGRYHVSFLPESPGTYNLAVTLHGTPIMDPPRCVGVSVGAGAELPASTSAGVGVAPAKAGDFDLSGAGGLAVEAWINPRTMPTQKASVVYKGGPARSGDSIKGYQITYDTNYVFTASVYVGRAEVRSVTSSAKSAGYDVNTWLHVGLLYDGSTVTLTFNGVVAASSETFATSKSAENPYPADADFTVGFGVDGSVDEVKLWDGSKGPLPTPATLAARLYCPPFKLSGLPGLAAYVPFSETSNTTSLVFSAACTPAL